MTTILHNGDINGSPAPMNHVFVDFENVQEVNHSLIGNKKMSFMFLLGPKQTRLNTALVEKLIEHAASIQLVRLTASGKNAVDFALAYYLGRAVLADPTAYFHIVSKDTGFDSLIEHLKNRHIHVRRHKDFTTLTCSNPAKAALVPQGDLLGPILVHLQKNKTNRPKSRKALVSNLLAFAKKMGATEHDISVSIEQLRKDGHISLSDKGAVTYHLT